MPTVRTYGPTRVSTAALPGVRKTAAETERSTGAEFEQARARKFQTLSGVGADVATMAIGVVARDAEEERLAADQTAVLEASVARAKWINERLNDPEQGALSVRGKEAMGLPEQIGQEYREMISNLGATMKTDRQRRAFARDSANDEINLDGTLRRHVASEMRTYQAGVLEATLETVTSTAINNANDPRRIGEALQQGTTAIEQLGPKVGLSAEQREVAQRKLATAVHTGVIDRLLVDGRDKAASVYFQETKSQIDGASIAKIEKALDDGRLRGEAQRQSDVIIAAGGTLTQQREKARNIDDPKLRDEVMQRIEHEAAVRDREEREQEEERSIQGYEILDRTQDVSKIPLPLWSSYSGGTRSAMREYARKLAKGEPVETDWTNYYRLLQAASGAPGAGTPADFVKINLLDYRHQLGESEFKQLAGLQASLRTGARDAAEKDLAGFRTKQEIVDNTLTLYGIDPKDKANAESIAQLQRMLDLRIEAAQSTGQKVTNVEIQQTLEDLLSQNETVPGSWWNIFPFGKSVSDTTKRVIDLRVGDIPATDRAQIENALRKRGLPISDARVLSIYLERKVSGGR